MVLQTGTGTSAVHTISRRSTDLSELGHLLAGVAHEVRNPLFAISAMVDALEEARDTGELLRLLRGEVRRLALLMEDLLEYGKPVAGTRTDCLSTAIERALASFARESARGAETVETPIRVELPSSLPTMRMDPDRLERVFLNLLKNARDCSPPGAEILLRCRLETSQRRTWVRCDVEDSGPGFLQEDLDQIWDPFYSRRPGGTGLGLSIVQRIIEQHDGSVTAENLPQGGARIRLCLPVQ